MNTYRNLHHHISNKLKKQVSETLLQYRFPKIDTCRIKYTVYFKDKRSRDLMNFVSVADKFILDHLVNIGCLPDDNYKYIKGYTIDFGGFSDRNYIEFDFVK